MALETAIQPAVPETSENELKRILEAQRVELDWWKEAPRMETSEDIEREVREGRAVRVPDKGTGYHISPGVREEFKVLEKNTAALLKEIAGAWSRELSQRQIKADGVSLRVTSLARTTVYQEELIRQNYPAVPDSTHTKLGAFDIYINWLRDNRPDLLEALRQVLAKISAEGRANCIEEPEIGVIHVAFNPTKIQ